MALNGNLTGSSQFFSDELFYNDVIGQSLRLSVGSNYKLDRQMVTPTSVTGTICTASWWMKKSAHGTIQSFIQCRDNQASGNYAAYWSYDTSFGSTGDHHAFRNENDSLHVGTDTSVVPYRDPSSWYHVVIRYDSTQGTAADRIRIYKNGTLQNSTFATTTYPSQNQVDTYWNNSGEHLILFGNGEDSGDSFDGYIAEFNWVDGQSLAPETFGELKNGVWIPKKITLSTSDYGLNGSRYTFADSSDIGKDTSGVGNDLDRVSNLAASDVVLDSPENNFCTTNGVMRANITKSEGNLKMVGVGGNYDNLGATFAVDVEDSEGWYWEYRSSGNDASTVIGFADPQNAQFNQSDPTGSFTDETDGKGYMGNGYKRNNESAASYGNSWTGGDIIGIAVKSGAVYFYKNGTIQASGAAAYSSITGLITPAFGINGTHSGTANFGQDSSFAGTETAQGNTDGNGIGDFYYAPPSGYKALCSANLPEPTIGSNSATQADDYFNTVIYTGSGSSPNAITGVGFQPDWVWIKKRSAAISHAIFDSSRGVTSAGATNKALGSDRTDAEGNGNGGLSAFGSDGFTLVDGTSGSYPRSLVNDSATYVAWNWLANGSQTSSNSDGSITSTVQANTTAGFSIVTYTGNGSADATYGHGLSSAPELMITKKRSGSQGWLVNGSLVGLDNYLELNLTNAIATASGWGMEATASLVDLGSVSAYTNTLNETYVSYLFHSVDGYSKFGSFTGNGNADGAFVFTGFRPAWVMVKTTGIASDWVIEDTTRSPFNESNATLFANLTNAEYTDGAYGVDFLSNGFKTYNTYNQWNASGQGYIYMAFAEAPFKYANAR